MKIQDIMVKDVVQVLPNESIREAARRMFEKSVGCLVVTSEGKVKGIITGRDLLVCLAQAHDPYQCKVSTHMSHPVIVERSEENVTTAADVMRRSQIKRLPVLKDGSLVGVISRSDIAAVVHAEVEKFWPTWVLTTSFVRAEAFRCRGPRLDVQATRVHDKKAEPNGSNIRRPVSDKASI
jgi:CBS domain-containing protein